VKHERASARQAESNYSDAPQGASEVPRAKAVTPKRYECRRARRRTGRRKFCKQTLMRTVQELRASPFEPAQSFDSLAGLPNASERACGHENDDSFTCFKATPTPHGTMLASQTTRGRALPGITMGRADIRLHTVHGRFPSLLNSRRNSRHSASSAPSNPAQAARSPNDTSHTWPSMTRSHFAKAALVAARHVS